MVESIVQTRHERANSISSVPLGPPKELSQMPSMEKLEGKFAEETKAIADFKKIILMTAGGAAKMQMDGKLDLWKK